MAILLKDLLKVSQRDVRIFNAITKQELDKTSCLNNMVVKTQSYVDKYESVITDIYVKSLDDIKEEYVESLNKANDVDFNSYISILMNGRSCL